LRNILKKLKILEYLATFKKHSPLHFDKSKHVKSNCICNMLGSPLTCNEGLMQEEVNEFKRKAMRTAGTVAHFCNPSYLGGRDRRIID
jgi:hypothetical protein